MRMCLFGRSALLWLLALQLISIGAPARASLTITRHLKGDLFSPPECGEAACAGVSAGTAGVGVGVSDGWAETGVGRCTCQCRDALPVFRDDLRVCVDDIQECNLAPFQSGTSTQRIPFVFLPMKGQIVYPSAEISFSGVKSPICVVSGAKFLTRAGWADLRNRSDTEPPFRMFRDEGRSFLQWLGTQELRLSMEGRLLLVSLMCKDMGDTTAHSSIFTPCVAFRVAGTPSVREVSFSADAHATESGSGGGLSASEFVAIAVCSVLLALMYIASVLLYLHTKRRHLKERRDAGGVTGGGGDATSATTSQLVEEGVVKNNPLLRHCHDNNGYLSDSHSCCTDTEDGCSDELAPASDDGNSAGCNNIQQIHTAAQIHPHATEIYASDCSAMQLQDSSAIERLPEENVSIVETLEMREDRPETVRAITTASTRRKLYFNPAYFEPEMLLAPPPAALEFLSKIREVIAIAKHKMAAKRFFPSLLGIPEEVDHHQLAAQGRHSHHGSVRSSVKTSRHERARFTPMRTPTCEGCPGCGFESSSYAEKECNDCCRTANESKQRSIRKWLEDVPLAAKPTKCEDEKEKIKVPPRRNYVNKGKAPAVPNTETIPKAKPEPIDKSEIIHLNKIEPEIQKSEVVLSSFISPPIQNNKLEEIEKRENERNLIIKTIPEPSFVITPAIQNGIRNSVNKKSLSKDNLKTDNRQKTSQKMTNNDSHSEKSISPKAGQKIKHPSQPPPPPPPPPPSSICSSIDTDKNSHLGKTDSPEPKVPKVARKLMDAVIKEFEVNRTSTNPKPSPPKRIDSLAINQDDENLDTEPDYETDSLERTLHEIKMQNNGLSTPSDYGEVVPRINSNSNVALPLDEELTMQNSIFNKKTGSTTMSKMKAKQEELDDHEYEVILLNPEKENDNSNRILPDILSRGEGYSLVSEVYVNDNFSYGSSSLPSNASSSSSSSSACSSLNDEHKISYAEEKPGHLTIQVEGTPTYKQEDSDSFEPDTLDRKPAKLKICEFREEHQNIDVQNELFTDSLERPPHISLRTNGSFRNNEASHWGNNQDFPSIFAANPLSRNFGSLREIFEARNKFNQLGGCNKSEGFSPPGSIHSLHSDTDCYSTLSWRRATPKILRPEARQARRQRLPSPDARPPRPPKLRQAQQYRNVPLRPPPPRPDAIPPLPPRSIKPPLPPKNGPVRSIVQRSEGGGGMANRPLPALPRGEAARGGGSRHQSRGRAPPPADASGCSSLASSEYEPVNAAPYSPRPPLTEAARAMRDTTLKQHRALLQSTQRTEDSGYLSTDSNTSDNRIPKHKQDTSNKRDESLSETDDSLCDGASESGGESIATDSFFFGNATPKLSIATSIDSGLGVSAPTISDTDSNVSFITVLPNGFGSRQGGVVLVP